MENKTFRKAIEIECSSNEEKEKLGEKIHDQLVGNEEYINNNIILDMTEDCKIHIIVFNECQNEPDIYI